MTRFTTRFTAAFVAIAISAISIQTIVTVPVAGAPADYTATAMAPEIA